MLMRDALLPTTLYYSDENFPSYLVLQNTFLEHWWNTVRLARTYWEIPSEFWEIGVQYGPRAAGSRSVLNPNFEEWRWYRHFLNFAHLIFAKFEYSRFFKALFQFWKAPRFNTFKKHSYYFCILSLTFLRDLSTIYKNEQPGQLTKHKNDAYSP